MKIAMASDHAGYDLKVKLKGFIEELGHEVTDYGTDNEESCDYPDYAHAAAEGLKKGDQELGIIMCGSGNGINMAANKHAHIRSALCWLPELAALARQHNNANVLALPARFIEENTARECVREFLNERFEGGRHERRVNKINA